MKPTPQIISKEDALRAYARMMHHLSLDYLEPLLSESFHYASQWVCEEITSKKQYLDYIRPKLETIRSSGTRVWAELGVLDTYPQGPCLVMAQGEKDKLVSTVLVEVAGDKIQRFDMCEVPPPRSVRRTGVYPV